mmetsp:Transcript_8988/g.29787  ORF Transcript_8988/g.29787 Transcript_8988/m.29787 type:complete len:215 (+) Transcript_8988:844-1488(+)
MGRRRGHGARRRRLLPQRQRRPARCLRPPRLPRHQDCMHVGGLGAGGRDAHVGRAGRLPAAVGSARESLPTGPARRSRRPSFRSHRRRLPPRRHRPGRPRPRGRRHVHSVEGGWAGACFQKHRRHAQAMGHQEVGRARGRMGRSSRAAPDDRPRLLPRRVYSGHGHVGEEGAGQAYARLLLDAHAGAGGEDGGGWGGGGSHSVASAAEPDPARQ